MAEKKAYQTLNPKERIITGKNMLHSCFQGVKASSGPSCFNLFNALTVSTYPANKKAQVVKADILASNGVIHAINVVV